MRRGIRIGLAVGVFFLFFSARGAPEHITSLLRKELISLKTSVIIPCVPKHFTHIGPLLQIYAKQTVPPDEIVISLSESDQIASHFISSLETTSWPFSLKIIKSPAKCSAGKNRNIACSYASGNLLLCQDADDLPHPQRVEIVKWLFENYAIDHLMHLFTFSESDFTFLDKGALKIDLCKTYRQMASIRETTNGNVCFTKNVFEKVQWIDSFKNGEDKQFNARVYALFPHKVVVHAPLLLYRNTLSSFAHE
jgi:glycosyltransferase involved in cell wall biosynthesis